MVRVSGEVLRYRGKGGDDMSLNSIIKTSLASRIFRCAITVCVAIGVLFGVATLTGISGNVYAGAGACDRDTLCGIGGKTFDAIYYSSGVSGLVVLYDTSKVGTLKPWVSETQYRKGTGTVEDAIAFLRSDSDYAGYWVVKGQKSTGFFRSEVVDGLYVVVPKHSLISSTRAPDFRFVDKGGTLVLYIRDFDIGNEDDGGS